MHIMHMHTMHSRIFWEIFWKSRQVWGFGGPPLSLGKNDVVTRPSRDEF